MQSPLAAKQEATMMDSQTLPNHQPSEYPSPQAHPLPPPAYQSPPEAMSTTQIQPQSPSAASPPQGSEHSDGDHVQADGRKGYGKRELSTSKRAAQNRAAQRAFRQRKEGYIKKLEEQVRDYQVLSENFKTIQDENYQLRDYIISLQSRLLESQHEVPPPPSSVAGLQPGKAQLHQPLIQGQGLPAVGSQPSQTLPRIAEMGSMATTPPHDPNNRQHLPSRSPPSRPEAYGFEQAAKRVKTSPHMSPAQSALQGGSVLEQNANQR